MGCHEWPRSDVGLQKFVRVISEILELLDHLILSVITMNLQRQSL